ncbi:DUF1152 domain-containing protein [Streptomyces sp. NPDC051940]|uniref:DUF1152 domain-containing protein n=1 Tax=Streptomyces sp. NPDC051940 TaxID=3155675 RepID=UPI0034129CD6
MPPLHVNPVLARLEKSERVLIAGAGGGFDVYAGLPLALNLLHHDREVHLANFSFATVEGLPAGDWLADNVVRIRPDSAEHMSYFPERTLAQWLARYRYPATVHAFPGRIGVQPLRAAYRALVEEYGIDAIVLVDGGTDILMRGDEAGLGTPEEDMTSLAAVAGLTEIPQRLVLSLGFGIDTYHGVHHAHVLENIAALERAGAYAGAFSITRGTPEGVLYLDAVQHAQDHTPEHPSIVHGSVAAAVRGDFGDTHFTSRTRGSQLFINPLMSLYFAFDLPGLAAHCHYLDRIEDTQLIRQVSRAIEDYRDELPRRRPPRAIPH